MAYSVGSGINFPARKFLAVTPSDTDDLPAGSVGLYVGTTGTLTVVGADDNMVTFNGAIGFNPIGVKRVMSTGTTASDIIALYA